MDSIRVSEAPDPGSIPGEATFNAIPFVRVNIENAILREADPFANLISCANG